MSFDLSGPSAKKSPKWEHCGGDMICLIGKPNVRLKLIAGKWRSVPTNKKNLTPKVQSANVSDT